MGFQRTVNVRYAFGVIGELFLDSPHRAESLVMFSNGTANNIGSAFTKNNQTNVATVGGTPATAAQTITGSITSPGGVMTVTGSPTLPVAVGDVISGSGITAGTVVTQVLTGTGGAGTYQVSPAPASAVSSETITVAAQGLGVVFAGILANPKVYASIGTTAGTLVPTLALPDYTQGEFITMGDIVVSVVGPANIGDLVQYSTTTGALSTVAPGASATSGNVLVPNGVIYRYPTVATGLTVLRMTN